jgi:hypothetical protein
MAASPSIDPLEVHMPVDLGFLQSTEIHAFLIPVKK